MSKEIVIKQKGVVDIKITDFEDPTFQNGNIFISFRYSKPYPIERESIPSLISALQELTKEK